MQKTCVHEEKRREPCSVTFVRSHEVSQSTFTKLRLGELREEEPGGATVPNVPKGATMTTDTDRVSGEATTSRVVQRAAWSPAQIFGVAGGVVLIAVGAIALARTGTNFSNVALTHAAVSRFDFTCISAAVQLAVGVILLASCVFPGSAKSAMAFFGVVLVAWGIVIVADVTRLFTVWGYSKDTGVFYIIVGGVLLVVAAISPIFMSSRREVNRGTQTYGETTPSGV
jgi:hypothetical protein